MSADKPRRLGRGLEALIQNASTARNERERDPADATPQGAANELRRVPLARIRANPRQPRKDFNTQELLELQDSLKVNGLLQPITVRPVPGRDTFEIVAGERRFRAATALGWKEIPALVREADDTTLLTLALVENLQRSDLGPLEEAEGYNVLATEHGLTQQQIATAVGKDRSTVANSLRLLQLPASIKRLLQEGALTLGHVRALLGISDERTMIELAREAVAKGLSVRDIESLAKAAKAPRPKKGGPVAPQPARGSAESRRIEDDLRRHLQTDVKLELSGKEKGRVSISFYSAEDLERVLDLILGTRRELM
jgi:ParB family transcriptional regulator, chromosome partitioning protein